MDLIKNKEVFKEHWVKSLNRWFEDGVETPGIIMIHVKADHIKFWQKEEEGVPSLLRADLRPTLQHNHHRKQHCEENVGFIGMGVATIVWRNIG